MRLQMIPVFCLRSEAEFRWDAAVFETEGSNLETTLASESTRQNGIIERLLARVAFRSKQKKGRLTKRGIPTFRHKRG